MRKFYRSLYTRPLSVFVMAAFLVTQGPVFLLAETLQNPVLKVNDISIPEKLGRVEEVYKTPECRIPGSPHCSGKQIIFIQDAHSSLEAQENIGRMIAHLTEHSDVRTVYQEGYEGPVPTDSFFAFIQNPEIRRKVSYFFLDKLRIGGAEYAHINRKKDFRLIGADSIKLHHKNIRQYQISARYQEEIREDLKLLFNEVNALGARFFPQEIKDFLKLRERYDKNEIELTDYLNRVKTLAGKTEFKAKAGTYPFIELILAARKSNDPDLVRQLQDMDPRELFSEIARYENDFSLVLLKTDKERKIYTHLKELLLIKRLNDLEVTPQEHDSVKETLSKVSTLELARWISGEINKTVVVSKAWELSILHALKFYDLAEERDRFIEKSLEGFLVSKNEQEAVLVFGGFHKRNIETFLRRNSISYAVVSPHISGDDPVHQKYYKLLMTVGSHPYELPAELAKAARPESLLTLPGARSEIRNVYAMAVKYPDLEFPIFDKHVLSSFRTAGTGRLPEIPLMPAQKQRSELRTVETVREYFKENKIPAELQGIFTAEILGALLADPAMEPVFLVDMAAADKGSQAGAMDYVNNELLQKIGGVERLKKFTGFTIGDTEQALQAFNQGAPLIVGLRDRHDDKRNFKFAVANERQVYFPLGDGLWLGVKGSGLSGGGESNFYYKREKNKWWGLVSHQEGERAAQWAIALEKEGRADLLTLPGGPAVQTLAIQRILAIPVIKSGKFSFTPVSQGFDIQSMDYGWEQVMVPVVYTLPVRLLNGITESSTDISPFPRLVFNLFTGSPHRLEKFFQILETDHGFARTRAEISKALAKTGELEAGTVLSESEWMARVIKNLGQDEGVRGMRYDLATMQAQDFTLSGQRADNEEIIKIFPEQDFPGADLSNFKGHGMHGIQIKLRIILSIMARLDGQMKTYFPRPQETLNVFFENYFSELPVKELELWALEPSAGTKKPRPLESLDHLARLDLFHSSADWKRVHEGDFSAEEKKAFSRPDGKFFDRAKHDAMIQEIRGLAVKFLSKRRSEARAADSSAAARLKNDFGVSLSEQDGRYYVSQPELKETSWTMNETRAAEKKPVVTNVNELPLLELAYPFEELPLFAKAGTSSRGVYLGFVKGIEHPVVIKMLLDGWAQSVDTNEMVLAQIFSHLGVGPRFFGRVLINGESGYVMQAVAGEELESSEYSTLGSNTDAREIRNRTSSAGLSWAALTRTPSGRLTAIDVGNAFVLNQEAFDVYLREANSQARSELRESDSDVFQDTAGKWIEEGSGKITVTADDKSAFNFVFERDQDPISEASRFVITVFYKSKEIGYVHAKFFEEGKVFLLDVAFDEGVLARNRIEAIYVKPELRKKYSGIGRSLMGLLMRLARSVDAREMIIQNAAAEDFYHSLGFEISPAGEINDYVFEFPEDASAAGMPKVSIFKRSELRAANRIKPEPASWGARITAWKIRKAAIDGRIKLGNLEKDQLREISKGRRVSREMSGLLLDLLEKSGADKLKNIEFEELKNYLLNVSAGLELYVMVPAHLRNVQNIQIGFGDADMEWVVPSSAESSQADAEDAYGNGFLQLPFLTRTFEGAVRDSASGLPVPPISQIRSIQTAHVQEGRTEGIFSADFEVTEPLYQGEQRPRAIFSVSRAEQFNDVLEKSFLNMRRLGQISSLYVPQVFASARGVLGRREDGGTRYLSMYSMQRLYGFTEINNNLRNGMILINGYPNRFSEDLSPADTALVKKEMIRIVTLYFERSKQIYGRRLMLGYIHRETKEFTGGPNVQAGDFMLDPRRLPEGKDFLRLITARELREKSIPEFIHLLLEAPSQPRMPQKQFSAENILQGIQSALVEIYGEKRGRELTDAWLSEYEAVYQAPEFFMRSELRSADETQIVNDLREYVELSPEQAIAGVNYSEWPVVKEVPVSGGRIVRNLMITTMERRTPYVTLPQKTEDLAATHEAYDCCALVLRQPAEDGLIRVGHAPFGIARSGRDVSPAAVKAGKKTFVARFLQDLPKEKAPEELIIFERQDNDGDEWVKELAAEIAPRKILYIERPKSTVSAVVAGPRGAAIFSMHYFMRGPTTNRKLVTFRSGRTAQIISWEQLDKYFEKSGSNLVIVKSGETAPGFSVPSETLAGWDVKLRDDYFSVEDFQRAQIVEDVLEGPIFDLKLMEGSLQYGPKEFTFHILPFVFRAAGLPEDGVEAFVQSFPKLSTSFEKNAALDGLLEPLWQAGGSFQRMAATISFKLRSEARILNPGDIVKGENKSYLIGRQRHSGIADLFEAEEIGSGRKALIKYYSNSTANPSFDKGRAFYAQEAAALKELKGGKYYPELYDQGKYSGGEWTAVERIEGTDLDEWLFSSHSDEERMAVMDRIFEAVEDLHARGIVHHDLKPANFMITPDSKIKIVDFEGAFHEEEDGTPSMTFFYAPGELQYKVRENVKAQKASDLFSLALIFIEIANGTLVNDIGHKSAAHWLRQDDANASLFQEQLPPQWKKFIPVIKPVLKNAPKDRNTSVTEMRRIFNSLRSEARATGEPTALLDRILEDQKLWFDSLTTEEQQGEGLGAKIYADLRQVIMSIDQKIAEGKIRPYVSLKLNKLSPDTVNSELLPPEEGRRVRAGVLAVTGNPLTWGHILIALHSMEALNLDTVIFIVQGIVTYKGVEPKDQIPIEAREKMVEGALGKFAPLLRYSDISSDTSRIGEDSWHQLRDLNPDTDIDFVYLAGSEETARVVRILNNLKISAEKYGLSGSRHRIEAGFFQRGKSFTQDDLNKILNEVEMPGTASVVEVPPLLTDQISSTRYRAYFDASIVPKEVHDMVMERGFYRSEARILSPGNILKGERNSYKILSQKSSFAPDLFYAEEIGSGRKTFIKYQYFQGKNSNSLSASKFHFQEAAALKKLQSGKYYPAFYDQGEHEGGGWIAMEQIEGIGLDEWIFSSHSAEERMQAMDLIFEAVEDMHNRGIVHHDLKPGNFMITPDNKIKIIDFESAFQEGTVGQPSMTMPYAPGEIMFRNKKDLKAQKASDLFTLGIIFIEMANGRPISDVDYKTAAFWLQKGDGNAGLFTQQLPADWQKFSSLVTGVLKNSPADRTASVTEMRQTFNSLRSEARIVDLENNDEELKAKILTSKNRKLFIDEGRTWLFYKTPLSEIDEAFYYRGMPKLSNLIIERALALPEGKKLTVVDWGAGDGQMLLDLSALLEKENLGGKVRLIGFGNDYYAKWLTGLKKGIEFIFDDAPNFKNYFKPGEIDVLHSSYGLAHLWTSNPSVQPETYINTDLEPLMNPRAGVLYGTLSSPDMKELEKKFDARFTDGHFFLSRETPDAAAAPKDAAKRSEVRANEDGAYQPRRPEDFAEDILKILDIHFANAEKDESLSYTARESAKQAGNQVVPVESKYILPFFQRRAAVLGMTLAQYRDFWRLILDARDFAGGEYKLYEKIFDFSVSRLELTYPMANFDREKIVSNAVRGMIVSRLNSEGPVKPMIFRFAALGDGGELLAVSKILNEVLKEILADPGHQDFLTKNKISDTAALARYLKLEFNFYDIRNWKLTGLEKQVEDLRGTYPWLPETPVYEFANLAIPEISENWEKGSTSFMIARNMFSVFDHVIHFSERVSSSLEDDGVYIVNPNDASLIIWKEDSIKLRALDSYPAVHDDYHVRVFSPVPRSELRAKKRDNPPYEISGVSAEGNETFIGSMRKLPADYKQSWSALYPKLKVKTRLLSQGNFHFPGQSHFYVGNPGEEAEVDMEWSAEVQMYLPVTIRVAGQAEPRVLKKVFALKDDKKVLVDTYLVQLLNFQKTLAGKYERIFLDAKLDSKGRLSLAGQQGAAKFGESKKDAAVEVELEWSSEEKKYLPIAAKFTLDDVRNFTRVSVKVGDEWKLIDTFHSTVLKSRRNEWAKKYPEILIETNLESGQLFLFGRLQARLVNGGRKKAVPTMRWNSYVKDYLTMSLQIDGEETPREFKKVEAKVSGQWTWVDTYHSDASSKRVNEWKKKFPEIRITAELADTGTLNMLNGGKADLGDANAGKQAAVEMAWAPNYKQNPTDTPGAYVPVSALVQDSAVPFWFSWILEGPQGEKKQTERVKQFIYGGQAVWGYINRSQVQEGNQVKVPLGREGKIVTEPTHGKLYRFEDVTESQSVYGIYHWTGGRPVLESIEAAGTIYSASDLNRFKVVFQKDKTEFFERIRDRIYEKWVQDDIRQGLLLKLLEWIAIGEESEEKIWQDLVKEAANIYYEEVLGRSEVRAADFASLFSLQGEPKILMNEPEGLLQFKIRVEKSTRLGDLYRALGTYLDQQKDFLLAGGEIRHLRHATGGEIAVPPSNGFNRTMVFKAGSELYVEITFRISNAMAFSRDIEKIETAKHLIAGFRSRLGEQRAGRTLVDLGSGKGDLLSQLLPLFPNVYAVERDRQSVLALRRTLGKAVTITAADFFQGVPDLFPDGGKADVILSSHSFYSPDLSNRIRAITESFNLFKSSGANHFVFVINDLDHPDPYSRTLMREKIMGRQVTNPESLWSIESFMKAAGFEVEDEYFSSEHIETSPDRMFILALSMLPVEERENPVKREELMKYVQAEYPEGLKIPGENRYRIVNQQKIIWASRQTERPLPDVTQLVTFPVEGGRQVLVKLEDGERPVYALMNMLEKKTGFGYAAQVFYPGNGYFLYDSNGEGHRSGRVKRFNGILRLTLEKSDSPLNLQLQAVPAHGSAFQVLVHSSEPVWIRPADELLKKLMVEDKERRLVPAEEIPSRFRFSNPSLNMLESITDPLDKWMFNEASGRYTYSKRSELRTVDPWSAAVREVRINEDHSAAAVVFEDGKTVELTEKIEKEGFSEFFMYRENGRRLLLKAVKPGLNPRDRGRAAYSLENEARISRLLRRAKKMENVTHIIWNGEVEGAEQGILISGPDAETLKVWRERLTLQERAGIFRQYVEQIWKAYSGPERGSIALHDLKPSNALLETGKDQDGRPVYKVHVIDLEAAKRARDVDFDDIWRDTLPYLPDPEMIVMLMDILGRHKTLGLVSFMELLIFFQDFVLDDSAMNSGTKNVERFIAPESRAALKAIVKKISGHEKYRKIWHYDNVSEDPIDLEGLFNGLIADLEKMEALKERRILFPERILNRVMGIISALIKKAMDFFSRRTGFNDDQPMKLPAQRIVDDLFSDALTPMAERDGETAVSQFQKLMYLQETLGRNFSERDFIRSGNRMVRELSSLYLLNRGMDAADRGELSIYNEAEEDVRRVYSRLGRPLDDYVEDAIRHVRTSILRQRSELRANAGDAPETKSSIDWKIIFKEAGVTDLVKGRPTKDGIFLATPDIIFDQAVKAASSIIESPSAIIDAGSGQGQNLVRFARAYPQSQVFGIESDPVLAADSQKLIAAAQKLGVTKSDQKVEIKTGDFNSPEFGQIFENADLVYYFSAGTNSPAEFVKTLISRLKPGALVAEAGLVRQLNLEAAEPESFERLKVPGPAYLTFYRKRSDLKQAARSESRVNLRDEVLNALPADERTRIDTAVRFIIHTKELLRGLPSMTPAAAKSADRLTFESIPADVIYEWVKELLDEDEFAFINDQWQAEAFYFLSKKHPDFKNIKWSFQLISRVYSELEKRTVSAAQSSSMTFFMNAFWQNFESSAPAGIPLRDKMILMIKRIEENVALRQQIGFVMEFLDRMALYAEAGSGRRGELAREFLRIFTERLFESQAMELTFNFNRSLVEGVLTPSPGSLNAGLVYVFSGSEPLYNQAVRIAETRGLDAGKIHALTVNRAIELGDREMLREYLVQELFTDGKSKYEVLYLMDTGFHGTMLTLTADVLATIPNAPKILHGRMLYLNREPYTHRPPASSAEKTQLSLDVLGWNHVMAELGMFPSYKYEAALLYMVHVLDVALPRQKKSPVSLERSPGSGKIEPQAADTDVPVFASIARQELSAGLDLYLSDPTIQYPDLENAAWNSWLDEASVKNLKRSEARSLSFETVKAALLGPDVRVFQGLVTRASLSELDHYILNLNFNRAILEDRSFLQALREKIEMVKLSDHDFYVRHHLMINDILRNLVPEAYDRGNLNGRKVYYSTDESGQIDRRLLWSETLVPMIQLPKSQSVQNWMHELLFQEDGKFLLETIQKVLGDTSITLSDLKGPLLMAPVQAGEYQRVFTAAAEIEGGRSASFAVLISYDESRVDTVRDEFNNSQALQQTMTLPLTLAFSESPRAAAYSAEFMDGLGEVIFFRPEDYLALPLRFWPNFPKEKKPPFGLFILNSIHSLWGGAFAEEDTRTILRESLKEPVKVYLKTGKKIMGISFSRGDFQLMKSFRIPGAESSDIKGRVSRGMSFSFIAPRDLREVSSEKFLDDLFGLSYLLYDERLVSEADIVPQNISDGILDAVVMAAVESFGIENGLQKASKLLSGYDFETAVRKRKPGFQVFTRTKIASYLKALPGQTFYRRSELRASKETALLEPSDSPVDWKGVFGNDNPMEVNVGVAGGAELWQTARKFPGINFVGFETDGWANRRFLERILDAPLNAKVVLEDAREGIEKMFKDGELSRINLVFFPPYSMGYLKPGLAAMQNKLKPGGSIVLITEEADFAGQFAEYFKGQPGFSVSEEPYRLQDAGQTPQKEMVLGSEFRKMFVAGTLFQVTVLKSDAPEKNSAQDARSELRAVENRKLKIRSSQSPSEMAEVPARWGSLSTRLLDIDAWMENAGFEKMSDLILKKARSLPAGKRLTVLDWGAGNGQTLLDLREFLERNGALGKVRLVGFGDLYFNQWLEGIGQGIEFVLADSASINDYFATGEIDFIFSHLGLYHLSTEEEPDLTAQYIHEKLRPLLSSDGLIITDVSDEDADFLKLKYQGKISGGIAVLSSPARSETRALDPDAGLNAVEAWKAYWLETSHTSTSTERSAPAVEDFFRDFIVRAVREDEKAKLLDVGTGRFIVPLLGEKVFTRANTLGKSEFYAIDSAPIDARYHPKYAGFHFRQIPISGIPTSFEKGFFSAVTSSFGADYGEDWNAVLRDINYSLKMGGSFRGLMHLKDSSVSQAARVNLLQLRRINEIGVIGKFYAYLENLDPAKKAVFEESFRLLKEEAAEISASDKSLFVKYQRSIEAFLIHVSRGKIDEVKTALADIRRFDAATLPLLEAQVRSTAYSLADIKIFKSLLEENGFEVRIFQKFSAANVLLGWGFETVKVKDLFEEKAADASREVSVQAAERKVKVKEITVREIEDIFDADDLPRKLLPKKDPRRSAVVGRIIASLEKVSGREFEASDVSAAMAAGGLNLPVKEVIIRITEKLNARFVFDENSARSEVRTLKDNSGLKALENITMKVISSDEEIVSVSHEFSEPGDSSEGITPSADNPLMPSVLPAWEYFFRRGGVPSEIATPLDFSGSDVLLIGPSRGGADLAEFIKKFPTVREIHLADVDDRVFWGNNTELRALKKAGAPLPKVYGYKVNALKLPDELSSKMDAVFHLGVVDSLYFSSTQRTEFGRQVVKVLKPGGIAISMPFVRRDIHEGDDRVILYPPGSEGEAMLVHIKKGHSRSEVRSVDLLKDIFGTEISSAVDFGTGDGSWMVSVQQRPVTWLSKDAEVTGVENQVPVYYPEYAGSLGIMEEDWEEFVTARRKRYGLRVVTKESDAPVFAADKPAVLHAAFLPPEAQEDRHFGRLLNQLPAGGWVLIASTKSISRPEDWNQLLLAHGIELEDIRVYNAETGFPADYPKTFWWKYFPLKDNFLILAQKKNAADLAPSASGAARRSEVRLAPEKSGLNARQTLKNLRTPALVYLDYKNLMEKFWDAENKTWNEQGAEIIKLASIHAEKIRLVIYGADITDERLKPFRELRESRRNVRITDDAAAEAYAVTQKDFVKGLKKYVNIHLSKDFSGVKNSFTGTAKDEMYFFRYETGDQSSGLLAAALLWADYEEAGKKMDGFARDSEGFLVLSESYLRAIVQKYEASLVVAFSA